jgi:signal transduction histidine kinase
MADGKRLDPLDDDAEQAALAGEASLIRRVRWRLVGWSGLSTLVVLVVLGAALYAAVAGSLAAASVQQLENRARPLVALLEGPQGDTGDGPEQGFVFGGGNTLLYVFDAQGNPVQVGDRPVAVPNGLPETAGLAAARSSTAETDVRTATLELAAPFQGPPGSGPATAPSAIQVPVRVLTREVVAQQDGNTYFLQVLQDRSTEVETLQALLTVLLVGGLIVVAVAVAFGWFYAERALVPIRNSLGAQRTALRRQREFAADASHELRTPLTVIRSSLEHVFRHPERPVGESREALDDIDAEVSQLTAMVDDLLLLARSDSGAVSIERMPVDLGDVAFDAASALGRTAEARDVRVQVDPEPAMLHGDPARLRQLVTILVDNAVRHSPRGGAVTVTVRSTGTSSSIEVADEGPGLRDEDMAHVFDRFWRAPGAPSGGTGLGLAIGRWIVDRHGGRIGVANRDTGGALFRVELPTDPPPPAAGQAAVPADPESPPVP